MKQCPACPHGPSAHRTKAEGDAGMAREVAQMMALPAPLRPVYRKLAPKLIKPPFGCRECPCGYSREIVENHGGAAP